jgi:hypothetical protein
MMAGDFSKSVSVENLLAGIADVGNGLPEVSCSLTQPVRQSCSGFISSFNNSICGVFNRKITGIAICFYQR